jgi:hypothetical protein
MSIEEKIAELEGTGRLTRFEPPSVRPLRRSLFLGGDALREFNDPHSATNVLVGRGRINAALVKWVTNGQVYASNGKPRFLKRLCAPPPEIWEMMVTEPGSQGRLFCRFARPNTLILLNLHTRNHLGKKHIKKKERSHNWETAMKQCADCWNALFPKMPPFSGPNVHAYITENCDDFEI